MDLSDFILMLQEDVARGDKEASGWYPKWVNRGLRKIQQDRSWNCMRRTAEVTISSGQSSVNLPSDFKELASERPAVFLKQTAGGSPWAPVRITSRAYMDGHNTEALFPPEWAAGSMSALEAYIEQAASGTYSLHTATDAAGATFRVQYFGFLPELSVNDDSNYLTNNYEEMCIAKIKEIAFLAINDPIAVDFMKVYREYLSDAWRDDQSRKHSGRKLRMGG